VEVELAGHQIVITLLRKKEETVFLVHFKLWVEVEEDILNPMVSLVVLVVDTDLMVH
jgi:hypothetical protein